MSDPRPIGVFDSGVGGLSVAREIRALLPAETLLYFADTANCPYGGRPLDEIETLALQGASVLVERGAKIVVLACNTATGAALEMLRARLDVPVVGLEPAVKPAAATSETGSVGVLATAATLRSARFARLVEEYAGGVHVVPQACPGLVELVEEGELSGPRVDEALRPLVEPLRARNVDVVVLGCTHYPFLRASIERLVGPGVRVIDSGAAVARQVDRVLTGISGKAEPPGDPVLHLLTTGDPESVREIVERLWDGPLASYSHVRMEGVPRSAGSST